MNVNMRDVAQHAGVSTATVSHVINNTRYVKEETKKRVRDSIEELGYNPNVLARSFKTGRRNLIAFIVPDIANPFFSSMIEEVESVIAPKGYKLLICNTGENTDKEADSLRVLSNGMVDGFIIASAFLSYSPIGKIIPQDIPAIFVDRTLEGNPCDMLRIDCYHTLQEGIKYLIQQGHTRIAFVTVKGNLSTTIERCTAYKDIMSVYNLPTDDLIFYANPLGHLFSENLSAVLNSNITAIIAPNSTITTEVLMLLEENSLTPGKDIELLGFKESNQPQYFPSLTHLICQPTEALGRAAGLQILERIDNPDIPVRQTILSSTFIPHK